MRFLKYKYAHEWWRHFETLCSIESCIALKLLKPKTHTHSGLHDFSLCSDNFPRNIFIDMIISLQLTRNIDAIHEKFKLILLHRLCSSPDAISLNFLIAIFSIYFWTVIYRSFFQLAGPQAWYCYSSFVCSLWEEWIYLDEKTQLDYILQWGTTIFGSSINRLCA